MARNMNDRLTRPLIPARRISGVAPLIGHSQPTDCKYLLLSESLYRANQGASFRVIVAFDEDGQGAFVITAFDLGAKALRALRRRMKKRGLG
jgi:hypothetical protein